MSAHLQLFASLHCEQDNINLRTIKIKFYTELYKRSSFVQIEKNTILVNAMEKVLLISYPKRDPSPNCWPDSNMLEAKAVWWSFL